MKKLMKINLVKFMQGLTLLIISVLLAIVVVGFSLIFDPIYYIITLKWQTGFNTIGDWMKKMALSIDQFGNASSGTIMNILFRKKGGIDFGGEDDTISYILARNYYHGTIRIPGRILLGILNLIDKNHGYKSVESKIEADQDALLRIQKDEYFK